MDKRLQLIEHLYDETSADTAPLRDLLADPEMAAEFRDLSRMRFELDHRPRARPRAAVINSIVRQASSVSTAPGADRPARRRMTVWGRRSWTGVALAAAVIAAVFIGPRFLGGPNGVGSASPGQETADTTPAETLLETLPPAAMPIASSQAGSLPEWDAGDDVRRLSRRIDALKAAGELSWDEPAVPLEMLPNGGGMGLTPAGSRR